MNNRDWDLAYRMVFNASYFAQKAVDAVGRKDRKNTVLELQRAKERINNALQALQE